MFTITLDWLVFSTAWCKSNQPVIVDSGPGLAMFVLICIDTLMLYADL